MTDPAHQAFLVEAKELLDDMEAALLAIEAQPGDVESVNAIFRAAHTIKGSAGLFGFDQIVEFTHVAESVLDKVRQGALAIEGDLVALLLQCDDHIRALVDDTVAPNQTLAADMARCGSVLIGELRNYLEGAPANPPACEAAADRASNDHWHISLRFDRDVLKHGMDPAAFIRYLKTLGEIVHMELIADGLPPVHEMDPECFYLGLEIGFKGDVTKEKIAQVFEFIRDDCTLHILPPSSKVADYICVIDSLPEDSLRLGELLVRIGTLTEKELEHGLATQRAQQKQSRTADGTTTLRPLGEILVEERMVQPEVVDAALDKQRKVQEGTRQESRLIRVHADKLDNLISLVGELVIAAASASLLARNQGEVTLQEATSTVSRLVEEIRDGALQLRMVQIGETFNRFHRVVHDVSREINKKIELHISGAETELDKSVVEKIADPLMHLVRNAMDHGIEAPDVRLAKGKPEHGTLRLNACHDSGFIVIEVSDDGGGLNRAKIMKKAAERGLVDAEQNLSDEEVYQLIFEPGFSTAETVTNLSGRGVGMDVVKKNITALRGSVEVQSESGAGTTVRIRLPLTLAIIDGFLMGVGEASYVVPLDFVMECVELSDDDQRAVNQRNYINLRGEVLPFLRLRDVFGVRDHRIARRENIIVVRNGTQKAGLVVDSLMGQLQTVIKPLGRIFNTLEGISGSTILGSGEVALILDVPALIARATSIEQQGVVAARIQH